MWQKGLFMLRSGFKIFIDMLAGVSCRLPLVVIVYISRIKGDENQGQSSSLYIVYGLIPHLPVRRSKKSNSVT